MKKNKEENLPVEETASDTKEQVASKNLAEQVEVKSEKQLEKERVKKEKKEWNYNRKVKRGFKALRGRKFKNFMFWLAGVVSGLVILATTVLVAVGVVPFKTYFGEQPEESISKEVGDKSLLAIAMGFKAYTESYASITEAFPIVDKKLKEALTQVDGYVQIDFDSIKSVPFTDPTFSDKLMSSIKITATLESVGASSMLGDFANLPLFKDDPALDDNGVQYTVKSVDTTTETFDYRLYNYYDTATEKYISASNEDSTDWAEAIKGTEAPLYYASLLTMPFSDITQVINERLGVIQVADLVETFSEGAKDGLIGDILGNTTIASMGAFDPDTIEISALIDRFVKDAEGNDTEVETDLYKMLRSLLGVDEGESIKVAHLNNGFVIDDIKISLFLDRFTKDADGNDTTTETETYAMLRSILSVPKGEEITVKHLTSGLDFDTLKLSTFIDRFTKDADGNDTTTETETYAMLRSILNVPEGQEILVSHLTNGLDFDTLKLSTFIDRFVKDAEGNDTTTETETYAILRSILSVPEGQEILVSHLTNGLDFDTLKLSTFIDRFTKDADGNDTTTETEMYALLRTVFNVPEGQEILVSHLSGTMSFDNVEISDFIDRFEADGITETASYKLLRKITGIKAGDISVSDLKTALSGSIKLSAFVDRFESDGVTETQIYRIIRSAFNVPSDRDITVDDIGGTFNIDNVNLSDFIDSSSNIYQIILSATGKTAGDEIKLSMLSSLSVNDCEISLFIPRSGNENIYKIIEEVVVGDLDKDGKPVLDENGKPIIRVKHLSSFNLNSLKLESVIDRYTVNGNGEKVETDLFRILGSVITGTGANGEILVKDISSFDVNEIKLSTVIDKASNQSLYDILEQAVKGTGENGEILVKDLKEFTLNDLEVSKLIDTEGKLYKIISDSITGTGENGAILVGDLSGFETKNIKMKLSDVIDRYTVNANGEKVETDLFKMLSSVVTGTGEDGEIMISDLSSFEVGNLPLAQVVDEDSKLYEIMLETVEGTGKNGAIIVSDLKNFKVANLRLSTVIDETDNNILKKLIEDDSVTISNLGDKINNLELQAIFEIECFTTDETKAVVFSDSSMGRYRKVVKPQEDCHMYDKDECVCEQFVLENYVLDLSKGERYVDDNIYYINKEAQIWLFMYFNDDDNDDGEITAEDFDIDGFAKSYKPMHLSLGNLQEKVAQMSDEVKHASIRQLVCSGLMDPNPVFENNGITYIYAQTVNDAIARK